jgi:hypothetical protein
MSSAISLLPIALVPCLYAALVKLAAFVVRRTKLRWSQALIYGVLALVVGAAGAVLNKASGSLLPLPVALLAGLAVQLVLGGWYFGPRATNTAGTPIRFKGGVVLSLVAYLLVFALGVLAAIVVPALNRGGQA